MKQIIQTLNLKNSKGKNFWRWGKNIDWNKDLDLSEILDMPFLSGLEKAKEIGSDIVKSIRDYHTDENGLTIILNCANEDTYGMAEAMIGHIVEALVDRDKLRVPDRYLGLATFDIAEFLVGGNFNILSLINYESGFDFIKIVALNEDHSQEKGLGVRKWLKFLQMVLALKMELKTEVGLL